MWNQEEEALTDGLSAALVGVEAQNAGIEEVAETITHNLFRINMRLLILVSVVLFFSIIYPPDSKCVQWLVTD